MSFELIEFIGRRIPSTKTRGAELLYVLIPLILKEDWSLPGSPELCTATRPANLPDKALLILDVEFLTMSADFTTATAPVKEALL